MSAATSTKETITRNAPHKEKLTMAQLSLTSQWRMLTVRLAFAVVTIATILVVIGCADVTVEKPTGADSTAKDEHGHAEGEHAEGEDEHEEGEEPHAEGEEGHEEGEEGHKEGEHEEHEEGELRMTPAAMKEAGITLAPVMRQPVTAAVTAPGRVVPTQGGSAHVGTIIPGRITRLNVSEGSYVGKGAVLAEIEAFEVGQLKGEVVTARAIVEQTRSAVARQERLAKENIGARKNLEEARAAYSVAVAGLRSAEARLRTVGIEPGSVGNGSFSSRLSIRSPISGVVSKRHVVLGEYLEANKDAFEVVNTATVWVDAQVPPNVAATLNAGSTGFIRDADGHRHAGRVRFISPTVDPESRTVTVRTEVSNPNVHLRPETFVTVEFERGVSGSALSIVKTAVEQEGTSSYVYREHEPGVFERVAVELGGESGERRIVRSGLKEGERIAVTGLFYLKSARQSGELKEHNH